MKYYRAGLFVLIILLALSGCKYESYQTSDVADYGIIKGNTDNAAVEKLFQEMFPKTIESSFKNVVYQYHAEEGDTISCEIFLSFQFSDKKEYGNYVATIAEGTEERAFPYGENWIEYSIADTLRIHKSDSASYDCVDYADVRHILVNPQTQTIVYSLIRVLDGGGTRVSDISIFFNHFGIDPVEYASRTS